MINTRNQIDIPVVFRAPKDNNKVEIAVGGYSPVTIKVTMQGSDPLELTPERDNDGYFALEAIIASTAKVEAVQ